MEISELKSTLSAPSGWFIFAGEEEYLKRYYLTKLRESIVSDEFLAPFNYIGFDGPDIDFGALSEAIKSPPLMSDKKLVVWRYADFNKMREGALRAMDELIGLKEDFPYTVLLFLLSADGFDIGSPPKKPSKLYAKFQRSFHIVAFHPSTDAQLISWLKMHFDANRTSVTRQALEALLFRSGHNMDVLNQEVEKLCCYANANALTTVTEREVERVASSTPESDTFALSNAVLACDCTAAFLALEKLKRERMDPLILLGMLARTYSEWLTVARMLADGMDARAIESALKLNPYKVKLYVSSAKRQGVQRISDAVAALARIDVLAKSGGSFGYCAIETFIARHF